ncbi:MAG: phosphoribosylformylglycinamidine cyclo-ligase, partial [Desulfuromonadaceae bacterium]
ALIGGETAEMPGMYADGEYDLAGFTVGVVDNNQIIDGSSITVGDKIVGIAASGLHSNGFSLARKVFFERMGLTVDSALPGLKNPLGIELLTPTKIYVKTILNLLRDFQIKGMAHITGGGLLENVPRVLPRHCLAVVEKNSWPKPPILELLKEGGNIAENEMYRTFNYGIGMAIVVPEKETDDIMVRLSGLKEQSFVIGEITKSGDDDKGLILV